MSEVLRLNGSLGAEIRSRVEPAVDMLRDAQQGDIPSRSLVLRGVTANANLFTFDDRQVLVVGGIGANLRHYMTDADILRVNVVTGGGEARHYDVRRRDLDANGEVYIVTDQSYRLHSIEHRVGGFVEDPEAGPLG